ncbi:MBL fold metallo-hydrolase [Micromonospora sp. ALFpr18c]|uniref:MBL fold metallo-hydrolase n=1 Tax=Micromonospora sp. ALFpr18c TaxID=1458665 RepID=UPI00124BA8EF|nr:MBL fold metallo-hydrolase [Micromonospora sp. ALFpr18c]KAB1937411.1 MBL fold metallo-hydrolase [Micromonospora sp. ALFpr18c]
MPVSRTLGSITVTALTDSEGAFFQPRTQAFPHATAAQWAEADRRDPASVTADGQWWLTFRSFAIRSGDGPVTLIDAELRVVDGATTLTPAVRLLPTPGHTPGHQSVLVTSVDDRMLLTGDLLVHMVQLVDPDLAYAHEEDREQARTSRLTALRTHSPTVLATPHLCDPFTALKAS